MGLSDENGNIDIQIARLCEDVDVDASSIKRLVHQICDRFDVSDVTVSIAVVDSGKIIQLNREFLGREKDTDVLSFDLTEEENGQRIFDLVVNGQMARDQADRRGHSIQAEIALYVTHGLLHQLGFDDRQADQAERMHAMENKILSAFGFGNVYSNDKTV